MGVFEVTMLMGILFVIGILGFKVIRPGMPDLWKDSRWRSDFTFTFFIVMLLIPFLFFVFFSSAFIFGYDLDVPSSRFMELPLISIWFPLLSVLKEVLLRKDEADPHVRRDFFLLFLLTLSLSLLFWIYPF